ncbi:MAG: hypothetical protein SGILL_000606, partial [Bacillariaceae sp.]
KRLYGSTHWCINDEYWKEYLVAQYDFPVAKVNRPGQISGAWDERLGSCTRFMDRSFFQDYNYSQYEEVAKGGLATSLRQTTE